MFSVNYSENHRTFTGGSMGKNDRQRYRGATKGGGRPGARPPLAPEMGRARAPCRMNITGIRKPIELL